MTTGLIVIRSGSIAFSQFIMKPNVMPTKIGWKDLINPANGTLAIPFGKDGTHMLNSFSTSTFLKDNKLSVGAIGAVIKQPYGFAEELYNNGSALSVNPISIAYDSFYTRSSDWDIETAATAGYFVYDEIDKIYRAALKACNWKVMPFYTGRLLYIGMALKKIRDLEMEYKKIQDEYPDEKVENNKFPPKIKKQVKAIVTEIDELSCHFEVHAKLQIYN